MIDMNKKYTFQAGTGRVLITDANNNDFPVIWLRDRDGCPVTFTSEGALVIGGATVLIEVKPTRWVNLYPSGGDMDGTCYHATRAIADRSACSTRIACIEFTEGDGI